MCLIGISDSSYHIDTNSVCGEIVFLGNKKIKDVSPLYWKSRVITIIAHLQGLQKQKSWQKLLMTPQVL